MLRSLWTVASACTIWMSLLSSLHFVHGFSLRTPVKPAVFQTQNQQQEASVSSSSSTTTTSNTGNRRRKIEKQETPPMAMKWPIIGTLPDFYARGGVDGLCDVYESMYKDFGKVFGISLLGQNELVVADPYVFDTVLRNEGKFPLGGAEEVTTFNDYYKENNLTQALKGASHGEDWANWRKSLSPDMFGSWETYLPTIADTCSKISQVAGYETTQTNNLAFVDFLSRAAFDMFTAVMYGESPQTTNTQRALEQDIEFVQASQTAFDITGALMTNPLEKVGLFGTRSNLYEQFVVNMDKTFHFANQKTKSYAERATQERHERQQQQPPMEEEESPRQRRRKRDILKAAFGLGSGGSSSKTDEEVNGEATTTTSTTTTTTSNNCPVTQIKNAIPTNFKNPSFVERLVHRGELSNEDMAELGAPLLMAGVDTTAYVMSWLYLNLASNPNVQTKLAQELKSVLNGADVTSVEQMDALPYLKACIRESHRLTPPGPIMTKKFQQDIDVVVPINDDDDEDNNTAYSYHVKAGQRISLNLRGIPVDERYVDNPTQFQPERFLPEAIAARKGTRSEIIDHPAFADPFGRGKRRCLGASVAQAEILILAARMIQDWEITLLVEDPNNNNIVEWKPKQKLMLKADPYPAMKLVARE